MHPNLLHIGHLYIPTFGLLAALGLAAGITLSLRTAGLVGVSPDDLWNAGLFAVFAAFVSSRLLLVLLNFKSFLSAPILLLMVPSLTAFGLLLAAGAVVVYLRVHQLSLLRALDAWAAPAALAWAFLALGHLAEGSDPGLPSRLGLRTSLAGYREQPVALYAAVLALLVAALLYRELRRGWASGRVAGAGLVCVGAVQFWLTFLRMPYVYEPGSAMAWLDPLQWVALGMVVAGAGLSIRRSANTGVPPLALLGREDGDQRWVPGHEDGDRGPGDTVRREHSMHAHQVQEQQIRRDVMRGMTNERES